MTGHETVQNLRELEHSGKELQRFAALNEAAGLLLSVARAFQPGDAKILDCIKNDYETLAETGVIDHAPKIVLDMLARLQAAAERLER